LKYEKFDLMSTAGIICEGVGITLISFGGIGVCCSAWANVTLSLLGGLLEALGGILLRPLMDYYVLEPLGISKWLE
jgi:drug/metabolite transporter (DMT)-like permease